MADTIKIGGELESKATGNIVAAASAIKDKTKNKYQDEINTETYSLVNDVNERLSGLSPEQQSALSVAAKATNNETKLGYYVCDTEDNIAAKVISNATGYVLSIGGSIKVKMTNVNTVDNATLNINSTGAKALYYAGERASAKNSWEAGETVEVYYDGTSFYANSVAGGGGDGVFDVSAKYPTSGVEGGNTYTLDGALAVLNVNLSASKKKGGMSIKFVQTSDNKYVQFRYMLQYKNTTAGNVAFANPDNWQGVEDEPTAGSVNLVKSGGVKKANMDILKQMSKELTNLTLYYYSINADGTFNSGITSRHAGIKCLEGQEYIIENYGTIDNIRYAFVTSIEAIAGGAIPMVTGTSVGIVPANSSVKVTIPSGCSYLIFNNGSSSYSSNAYFLCKSRQFLKE